MLISMRLIGIDYGSKRVGIALSDEKGLMAFPKDVIPNDSGLIKNIVSFIETENVEMIVVGHSLGRDGKTNPIHKDVEEFITALTLQTGLPIELEPEQYTTQEAIRFQGRTDKTDAAAASIILNSYITRMNNKKNND